MPDGLREGLAIQFNEEGVITSIGEADGAAEHFPGILSPGHINSHCHLELSHMRGAIPKETGLAGFAFDVVTKRNEEDEAAQLQAMRDAEEEMQSNGIVAVGDICNSALSFQVKKDSKLRYHSFIELVGFDPARAEEVFARGKDIRGTQDSGLNSRSLSPHAPYSVSGDLVAMIRDFEVQHTGLMTIHNQESLAEDEFFFYASGPIIKLYEKLGVDLSHYKAQRQSSLRSILPWFGRQGKVLLVHNTFTKPDEIGWAELNHRNIYWCFCPNANLYIEKKLPNIFKFYDEGVKIVLGTDSIASNDQLSIVEEMKTIRKYFPQIPLEEILQWPTKNAAEYFGWEDLGTFAVGKKPGWVVIAETDIATT